MTIRQIDFGKTAQDYSQHRAGFPKSFFERLAGFQGIEPFSYDVSTPYSHEAWRGRIRASVGVAASLPPEQVACFDAALCRLLT